MPDTALARKTRVRPARDRENEVPLTEGNLIGHELIGLRVQVARSSDRRLEGISGAVVDETESLLVIETDPRKGTGKGRTISVQKNGTTFRFSLPGRAASEEEQETKKVDVEGWTIHAKPEERTKRLIKLLRARAPRK